MNDSPEQNVAAVEVAPQTTDAPSEPVVTTETVTDSPVETPTDKEELILGKFKSQADLEKSYKELESYVGKVNQNLRDPDYVYELARQHGMTHDEAMEEVRDAAEAGQEPPKPQSRGVRQPQVSIDQIVDQRLATREDFNEAVRLMPEIKSDPELASWASSLVDSGKSHVEAVKIIQTKQASWAKKGVQEGATIRQEAEAAKEQATTAQSTAPVTGAKSEAEDIRERMQSRDTRVQQKAYEEWQLYKMRNPNYKK